MKIEGHHDSAFEPVIDAFRDNFTERGDVGASFALSLDGEMKVDIWAGHLDEARSEPWREDTLVNVYSTTKTMTALSALLLADRGELDFSAPVARYWPEFRQAGKKAVEVRHLMSHAAGLSGLDEPTTAEDLYDWEKITALLAAQAPWWEPGTASGYHALTQGYLVGEVARRITGESLGAFFHRELAEPLSADFFIGLPVEHDHRVGRLIPPPAVDLTQGLDPTSIAARTFANPAIAAKSSWTSSWRRAEIPAANGHGNARSVVRAQTLLACGGEAWGKRLMSEAGCRKALEVQIEGTDLVLGVPLKHGMGYGITSDDIPISPNPRTCFWGGWGGSSIVVDLDARLCFSYVMNRMEAGVMGDPRGGALGQAVYRSLAGAVAT